VYADAGRNKTHTARQLGIGINTLRRKLESYGVE
jgi:DNA-binding protein Fis